jgi:hypothetical protein
MNVLERFKPGIPKGQLYFVACAVWSVAGMVLCYRGGVALVRGKAPALAIAGLVAGVAFYRFMFVRIPRRHIGRIDSSPHQSPCAFSFLDWKGYGMMALMISLGVTLRMSHVVSDSVLGVLYISMGVALLISALEFAKVGMARKRGR